MPPSSSTIPGADSTTVSPTPATAARPRLPVGWPVTTATTRAAWPGTSERRSSAATRALPTRSATAATAAAASRIRGESPTSTAPAARNGRPSAAAASPTVAATTSRVEPVTGVTCPCRAASRAGPIPLTWSSSASDRKPPCAVR